MAEAHLSEILKHLRDAIRNLLLIYLFDNIHEKSKEKHYVRNLSSADIEIVTDPQEPVESSTVETGTLEKAKRAEKTP